MQSLLSLLDKAEKVCGGTTKLAERLGIPSQNVSLMKSGRRQISPATAAELADITGDDIDEAIKLAVFESVKGTRRELRMKEILGKALAAGGAAMLLSSCSAGPSAYTESGNFPLSDVTKIYIVSSKEASKNGALKLLFLRLPADLTAYVATTSSYPFQ